MSLYLMCVYGNPPAAERFQAAWKKTGKKLDMGKACIRFKKADDLALDVIADTIRSMPAKKYIECVERAMAGMDKAREARSAAKKKPLTKKAGKKAAGKAGKKAVARGR